MMSWKESMLNSYFRLSRSTNFNSMFLPMVFLRVMRLHRSFEPFWTQIAFWMYSSASFSKLTRDLSTPLPVWSKSGRKFTRVSTTHFRMKSCLVLSVLLLEGAVKLKRMSRSLKVLLSKSPTMTLAKPPLILTSLRPMSFSKSRFRMAKTSCSGLISKSGRSPSACTEK